MKAIKTGDGVAAARAMMMLYPKEKRLFLKIPILKNYYRQFINFISGLCEILKN
jgi:hypothetical protein